MTTRLMTTLFILSSLIEMYRQTKRKKVGLFSVESSLMCLRETKRSMAFQRIYREQKTCSCFTILSETFIENFDKTTEEGII